MKFRQKFGSVGQPLAIDPKSLDILFETTDVKENCIEDGIAIVSICGALEHHYSWMFDSYDAILERLEAAFSSDDVHSVVMCIDSPGGDAAGSTEAHRQIQALKKKYNKKLYAYSNESMYSAAYSIGSAADEIVVPETGGVGSVGVICSLLDKTKQNEQMGLDIRLLTTGARKADTQADRPFTDDVIESIQSRVDYLGNVFFKCVAKARGVKPKAIKALEAGVFMGQEAIDAGLADRVSGWYEFINTVKGEASGINVQPKSNGDSNMKTLAQLKKIRSEAAKKLLSAKSGDERKELLAAYDSASTELADFQAKTKYVKKTEERLTEEADEEEEDDEDDDDDDDDDDSDDEEDSEEEESEEEESEEDAEEEEVEEKKAKSKKMKQASDLSLKSLVKIANSAIRATGKNEPSEVCGSLDGMSSRLSKTTKVEARLAKIEGESRKVKIKNLLEQAQKDGRVTPFQAKGLFEQGMKDPKWLKGYLDSQPKQSNDLSIPDLNGMPDSFDQQNLSRDQQKMLQQAANSAGMSVEQYQEQIKKYSTKSNGSLPRT